MSTLSVCARALSQLEATQNHGPSLAVRCLSCRDALPPDQQPPLLGDHAELTLQAGRVLFSHACPVGGLMISLGGPPAQK